jgi:hypothetical protein
MALMHPFDEWFSRTYPGAQPPGTRETALMAWNAAVHTAQDRLSLGKDKLVKEAKYECAAVVRDLREDLKQIVRKNE